MAAALMYDNPILRIIVRSRIKNMLCKKNVIFWVLADWL